MRWEELSLSRGRGARPRARPSGPAARLGRAARPPHAARHRHHAGARGLPRGRGEACPARRGAAAALVRLLGPPHALSGHHHAARRDADGARRGHRRLRRRARLPPHPHRQRPWRQCGVIDVLASTLGHRHYGRARIAALTYFPLAREAIARAAQVRARRHGPCLRVRDLDDPASAPGPGQVRAGRDHLSRSRLAPTSRPISSALRRCAPTTTSRDLSPTGTLGDPSLASPEAGAAFFAAVGRGARRLHRGFPRMDASRRNP